MSVNRESRSALSASVIWRSSGDNVSHTTRISSSRSAGLRLETLARSDSSIMEFKDNSRSGHSEGAEIHSGQRKLPSNYSNPFGKQSAQLDQHLRKKPSGDRPIIRRLDRFPHPQPQTLPLSLSSPHPAPPVHRSLSARRTRGRPG